MPNHSSKDGDANVLAARIVAEATEDDQGDAEPEDDTEDADPDEEARREAARILGRLGGLKGGKARAKKLSAKRRSEIAKKAAEARWKKRSDADETA